MYVKISHCISSLPFGEEWHVLRLKFISYFSAWYSMVYKGLALFSTYKRVEHSAKKAKTVIEKCKTYRNSAN